MIKVTSSRIEAYGFDPSETNREKGTLKIRFVGGKNYHYHEVGKDIWLLFKKAESKGKFFEQNIKGIFDFTKIEK